MHLHAKDDIVNGETVYTLTITHGDMQQARYEGFEHNMEGALQRQQNADPTIEGALMVLQMQARAIERAKPGSIEYECGPGI